MDASEQFKDTFLQECEEQLAHLEQHLSELLASGGNTHALHAAFRAVHSIKGGAGMLGYKGLAGLAHVVESALDRVRRGELTADRGLVDKALTATDVMSDMTDALRSNGAIPTDADVGIIRELAAIAAVSELELQSEADATFKNAGWQAIYRITFVPSASAARAGLEPLLVARNLAELGDVVVDCDTMKLPAFEDLDPVACYLGWTFELTTTEAEARVREALDLAGLHAEVTIECIAQAAPETLASHQLSPHAEGETSTEASAGRGRSRYASIRVDLDRVDKLFDLVGEVTIAQSMLVQEIEKAGLNSNAHVHRALSHLVQLSRNLQEGVMAIRAQPVRSVFSRMPRVAREVALETGKQVRLVMDGEATEIDKTIIEHLADPLMHIVRNSVDHGIETAQERVQAGKPAVGTVRLTAAQRGGRIVVTISDDGRGIDRASLLNRARARGIVDPDTELTTEATEALVFEHGLSTADRVSEISGRGVGMDVVAQNVQSVGGRVTIRSEPGIGCTTTITLPLTLAVLDAMLIESGGQTYFIAMSSLLECLIVPATAVQSVPGSGEIIRVRGEPVAFVSLAQRLGLERRARDRFPVVLVEGDHGRPVALAVDEICGYRQIVVKSIDGQMSGMSGISGATILGDGRIGFVLDVAGITSRNGNGGLPFKARFSQSEVLAA